jgi:uncharacterized iron-regulated membrane protein
MRRLIVKIHLMIALIGGVFMVVLALTGSVIAFEPELDRLLHSDISYVKPAGRSLSLAEIGAVVSRKYPGEPIVAYLPSPSSDLAAEVILSRGIVAVNPYTREILGVRTRGRTFLGFVRALHVRLATGALGRGIVKWSSVALLFAMVSGVYLWWPRKVTRIRGRRWTTLFWWDLHNVIGVFSLLPLLALTATGVVIGFENQFGHLLDRLGGSSRIDPVRVNVVQQAVVRGDEITPDQALAVVSTKFPGDAVHRVQMPEFGGLYRVSFAKAGRFIIGEEDSVSINPHSAEIVAQNLSRNFSLRERFMVVNGAIHTGSILGTTTKITAAAACLSIPVQAVSGLLLWLRRSKRMSGGRS